MDELTLDNKKYLSSKRAAKVTGYAKDYIGQLCREGRVDARLVGRNWYVLESSILEHRFGAESQEEMPQNEPAISPSMPGTWAAPTYAPEEVAPITESLAKPHQEPVAAVEPVADTQKVLADMQSAWKEWFDRQERVLPESPETHEELLAAPEERIEEEKESIEEPAVVEQAQEIVPIHIQRVEAPEPLSTEEIRPIEEETIQIRKVAPVRREAPQPRMIAAQKARKPSRNGGNMATRAILIGIAGIAVAITVLGSGLADGYIKWDKGALPVTAFFGGIQEINK